MQPHSDLLPPTRRAITRTVAIAAAALFASASSGCSAGRFSQDFDCALIGAGVGAAAGIVASAANNSAGGEIAASGAGGALVGGLIGYGICVVTNINE